MFWAVGGVAGGLAFGGAKEVGGDDGGVGGLVAIGG